MIKKLISITICFSIIINTLCVYASAAYDTTSSQLGFAISKTHYNQFGYIFERSFSNYYNGKKVGITTYSYSYCRGKQKSLGYYSDLCAIKILTEPRSITLKNGFLFFNWDTNYKFRINSLCVESEKSKLNTSTNPFVVNKIEYATTADSATKSSTTDSSLSFSVLGTAGISINKSETVDKSIVDVIDNSSRTKMKLTFTFGNPSTSEQKERVYEQTNYYILQEYLSHRKSYTNVTSFNAVYGCDGKTSSYKYTVSTPLKFK